jgi:hypothetical protein
MRRPGLIRHRLLFGNVTFQYLTAEADAIFSSASRQRPGTLLISRIAESPGKNSTGRSGTPRCPSIKSYFILADVFAGLIQNRLLRLGGFTS